VTLRSVAPTPILLSQILGESCMCFFWVLPSYKSHLYIGPWISLEDNFWLACFFWCTSCKQMHSLRSGFYPLRRTEMRIFLSPSPQNCWDLNFLLCKGYSRDPSLGVSSSERGTDQITILMPRLKYQNTDLLFFWHVNTQIPGFRSPWQIKFCGDT